jgi:tetratricopeptide (TPR) repeat protein
MADQKLDKAVSHEITSLEEEWFKEMEPTPKAAPAKAAEPAREPSIEAPVKSEARAAAMEAPAATEGEPEKSAVEPEKSAEAKSVRVTPSVRRGTDVSRPSLRPPKPSESGAAPVADQPVDWQRLAAELDREAGAAAGKPEAARFYLELGRVYEEKLGQPRYAAISYQTAFTADKNCIPNIAAAKRLFAVLPNWEMAAHLSAAELEAMPPEKAGEAILKLGMIYLFKLGDMESARAAFEKALEVRADFETLLCFEEIYLAGEPPARAAELFGALAEAANGEALKNALTLVRARIQEEMLGDEAAALESYRRAWGSDPLNDTAYSGYLRLLEKSGRWTELVDVLSKESEIIGGEEAARLSLRAARICGEEIGDSEGALVQFGKAADYAPENLLVTARVSEAYEGAGRTEELARVLERLAELTAEPRDRASIHFRIGELLSNKLNRDADAAVQYRKTLELNPAYVPAAVALGRLYQKDGSFDKLVELYRMEAAQTEDRSQKLGKLFKAAEILEDDVGLDDEAAAAYAKVLELDPSYLPAIKALGRLYGRLGRYGELVEVYEKELTLAFDKEQAVFLLEKIGGIWEEKLGDLDKAAVSYRRILEVIPNHLPTLRTLERICTAKKDSAGLLALLNTEIELCNDRNMVVPILQRIGEIHEEELGDSEKAIVYYLKALEHSPAYLPVLKALGRIFHRTGRFRELIEMHRREIDATTNQEQVVSLLFRVGEIQLDSLGETEAAIETFEKIISMKPDYLPALKALEKVYIRSGAQGSLADVYLREEAMLAEPLQKAIARFRAAEIVLHGMKQPEKAIAMIEQCLELVPGYNHFFAELERLYTSRAQWTELAVLFSRGVEWARVDSDLVRYNLSLAEICHTRLGDASGAVSSYEKVLEIEPGNMTAFQGLDEIYTKAGDRQRLAALIERWAAAAADEELAVSLHIRAAMIGEARDDGAGAAAVHYLAVLDISPSNEIAMDALELLYKRAGDMEGLIALCRHRLSVEKDPAFITDLHMRLAHLLSSSGAPLDDMIAELRLAAGEDLSYLPALLMLRDAYWKAESWRELVETLASITRLARDPSTLVQARMESGMVMEERLSDPEGAVASYLEAFNINPGDHALFARLEANLEKRGEWGSLADLYSTRANVLREDSAVFALSMKAGALYEAHLGSSEAALGQYARAVTLDPNNAQALMALSRTQSALGQWVEAAQSMERVGHLVSAPEVLIGVHRALGVIYHERLNDTIRASEHFQHVLAYDSREPVALEHLAHIFMQKKAWPSAIQMFRLLMDGGTSREKQVQYLTVLSDIYYEGYGDDIQAGMLLRKALEIDYGNDEVLDKLCRIYEKSGDWHWLLATYDSFIAAVPQQEKLSAVPIMLKKGEVYASRLKDLENAAAEYRKVLDVAPNNLQAMVALAGIYSMKSATFKQAVEVNRRLIHVDPFRQESYKALLSIFEEQKASDKAGCVFSTLEFLRSAAPEDAKKYEGRRSTGASRSASQVSQDLRDQLIVHPRSTGLPRRLLRIVGGELFKVFTPPMETYQIGRSDKIQPRSKEPLRSFCDEIAATLSIPAEYDIYLSGRLGKTAVPENTEVPAILLGRELVNLPFGEQRFEVARALSYIKDNHMVVPRLNPDELELLYFGVLHMIDASAPLPEGRETTISETARKLSRTISRKSKKALEDLVVEFSITPQPDFAAWKRGVEMTASRTGLAVSGEVGPAMTCLWRRAQEGKDVPALGATLQELQDSLNRNDEVRDLLAYSVSEEYFGLRELLGTTRI